MARNSIIITAGGTGKRMGGNLPKQFLLLAGKPLLFHTIQRFYEADPQAQIILSLPAAWHSYWLDLCIQYHFEIMHELVEGGQERFHSIRNALQKVNGDFIAVHDGVRPLVSKETILRCFETAAAKGNAVPVTPVKESLRVLTDTGSKALIRSDYRLVQTPQVFEAKILQKAYTLDFHEGITDDASLAEASGIEIHLVEGNEENIKITTPLDLILGEELLKSFS